MSDSDNSRPPSSAAGTVVILTAVLATSCLLILFLVALLGPLLIQVVGIAAALVAFGGLHYWLWGRSMPEREPDDEATTK
jgi:hypothetical protein